MSKKIEKDSSRTIEKDIVPLPDQKNIKKAKLTRKKKKCIEFKIEDKKVKIDFD